ncbi:MAG: ferrochelatase [Boseongicola sp.]|nr:ferrochelatase [Boseongicola sp.]
MKKTFAGFAIAAMMATTASAGGLDAPLEDDVVMAPEIIVEESTASSGSTADMIMPLVTMALMAAGFLDG